MKNNQDKLEKFIKENKDKFDTEEPSLNHEKKFLNKLSKSFKKIYVKVPRVVRIFLITLSVLVLSFIVWDNFLEHPSDQKPLSHVSWKYRKLEYSYEYQIHKLEKKILKDYIKDDKDTEKEFKIIMKNFDVSYDYLKRRLKQNPNDKTIIHSMVFFYQLKLEALKKIEEDYEREERIKQKNTAVIQQL